MSSPIEVQLLKDAVPELMWPYNIGLNIGCGGRAIGGSIGLDVREHAGAAVILADARQLPVRSNSLDYIVSCHCLEHLRDGPLEVLREWVRCLKLGAPLGVCVPDGGADAMHSLNYQMSPGRHRPGSHVSIFTEQTLRAYLVQAGLESVSVTSGEAGGVRRVACS
jgi:predicted SAM-dependent methyltransferase